ncbi:hypothetical protein KM031_13280 [Gemmobacter fulvus]|uniref:DUF3329 domain-containing protein n=1 Tax=Gemmobacter fulvus TaxID=2840474 RepID=A0A975P4P9_9RHOB|nr:hypothetical protein [Gemmobacter fulvus]MBT9247030.1 hypothetical protein [Gemmobacter fulvus]MDQ1847450.1 hypothetical protein [Gemmobacter fulvus]QWK89800.1 hypothetical protein KM031_13280 [Gemmobacter fulvus]
MRFIDANHPFFKPVWRRWAVSLAPVLWAAVEVWTGNPGWAILFGGAGAYAFYALIIEGPSDS